MQTRQIHTDFMRGICIILVVVIHLIFAFASDISLSVMHRLCIPQYVILIGYNMNYSLDKPYAKTVLKTLSKMIYVFFVTIIITQLVFDNNKINITQAITTIYNGTASGIMNLPIWFVPFYISLFLVNYSIIKLVKVISDIIARTFSKENYYNYALLFVFGIILSIIGINYNGNNMYYIKHALICSLFVPVGFFSYKANNLIDEFYNKADKKKKLIMTILLSIVFLLSLALFIIISIFDKRIDILPLLFNTMPGFYISSILGYIVLFFISKILCQIKFISIFTNLIAYLGKRSLWICCLHQPVQVIILPLFNNLLGKLTPNSAIDIFYKVIITMISAIIFSYVFEREK